MAYSRRTQHHRVSDSVALLHFGDTVTDGVDDTRAFMPSVNGVWIG
jgi:hypothetical protein